MIQLLKHRISIISTFIFVLGSISSVFCQGSWVPKAGVVFPSSTPVHEDIAVDGKTGFTIGADYRIGGKKVYFNPGLHYASYAADLLRIDTLNGTAPSEFLADTRFSSLRIVLGGGAILAKFNENSNFHLNNAFTIVLNTGSPTYGESGLADDFQRKTNWEYLVGFGFDISKFVIDFNYNLNFLKEFRETNKTLNTFIINIGYKI